jgi:23S rRNA (cytidine1920-2'-O)/16S rRNA (cytidine1409-2'-O)-methyltransferase
MPRRRLDAELVRRGLAPDADAAAAAVAAGRVTVGGGPATNAAAMIAPDEAVRVAQPSGRFVSRGGEKLAAALERFGLDPTGREALDAGASTGGFTDCLLQAGAARIVAVDVGYGQLAWSLRRDPRVVVRERTNVRDLTREDLPAPPSIVAADLSFVSLAGLVPHLVALAAVGADLVLLVKPQFEAPQEAVGEGGVVRDRSVRRAAIERVASAAEASGAGTLAVMTSPITGPAGNVEFLLHARAGAVSEVDDPGMAADEGPDA